MKNYGQTSEAKDLQTKESLADATVAFARDLTPEESDAIIDNTAFVWQTSGGSANIPAKSSAIISKILGNTAYGQNGQIVPFTATSILSRVYNLFNPNDESLLVPNKLINNYGQIVDNDEYNLYCVPVLAGVNGGNNGYVVVYDPNVAIPFSIDNMGFSETMPTAETENITLITASAHGNSTSYLPASDGYLCFSYPKTRAEEVCIHFAWSGYNDAVFATYEAYSLPMPSQVHQGLFAIGSICDEINNTGKYIKRIGSFNSKDANWERWEEEVYDIATETYIMQFVGYKTTYVQSLIARSAENVTTDSTFGLTDWQSDTDGVLKVAAASEDADILAQLTSGISIYYELATPEETDIEYHGLLVVGDFGDMHFFGTTEYYAMGNPAGQIPPSSVVAKYGTNYRDTIRSLANSGVTFNANGVVTSGLFFGQPIETKTLNGTSQWDIDDLRTMMRVLLSGSTNTITLPNGGENPFRFQIIVVQDSTGSRALTISGANGTNVFNPSEFDFSSGGANQLCVCTIIWDCNEYIYECTNYVGGN